MVAIHYGGGQAALMDDNGFTESIRTVTTDREGLPNGMPSFATDSEARWANRRTSND